MKRFGVGLGIAGVLAVAAGVVVGFAASGSDSSSRGELIVQGTTDIRDAGLLGDVIVPGFESAYPEYTLKYVAVGSGAALTNARSGQGDVALTHAPTLEKEFVADGFSAEPLGRAVFYSDYVILGPPNDPAGVLGSAPHDAVSAYEAIAAAGRAGKANFVSRGDDSGTNTQEKLIWSLSDVPLNSADEPRRDAGSENPGWYHKGGGGQAETVQLAATCPFDGGNCYEMTDRGTFNRLVTTMGFDALEVVSDHNDSASRGGGNLLTNPFTAYAINPDKASGANLQGAKDFLDYLTSPDFQERLETYPTSEQPAFFPDARPTLTVHKPGGRILPERVDAGTELTITGYVANALPGSPPLTNVPVLLEGSDPKAIARTRTGADGQFILRFRARRGGSLRLRIPGAQPDLAVDPLIAVGALQETTLPLGRLAVDGP